MYLYVVVHKMEDFYGSNNYVITVCENLNLAEIKKSQYCKNSLVKKDEVVIIKKRVDQKAGLFIVKDEFDEAGMTFFSFLYASTSEKRAQGYVENFKARNKESFTNLKIHYHETEYV